MEWIKDDAPYFGMNRASTIRPYTPPSAVLEIFKAEFDGAVDEGGLFLLTMHPHIIGHRSRIALLADSDPAHEAAWTASGSPPTRRSPATVWRTAAPRADSI